MKFNKSFFNNLSGMRNILYLRRNSRNTRRYKFTVIDMLLTQIDNRAICLPIFLKSLDKRATIQ